MTGEGKMAMWRADPRRAGEMLALAGLMILGGCVAGAVWSYPRGSTAYPLFIACLLMLLAGLRLIALLRRSDVPEAPEQPADEADDSPREDLGLRPMAIYAASVTALVVSLDYVWFPIAAFVAGAVVLRLVFGNSWRAALLSAFLVSGGSSLVFWALQVPLPGSGF